MRSCFLPPLPPYRPTAPSMLTQPQAQSRRHGRVLADRGEEARVVLAGAERVEAGEEVAVLAGVVGLEVVLAVELPVLLRHGGEQAGGEAGVRGRGAERLVVLPHD